MMLGQKWLFKLKYSKGLLNINNKVSNNKNKWVRNSKLNNITIRNQSRIINEFKKLTDEQQ